LSTDAPTDSPTTDPATDEGAPAEEAAPRDEQREAIAARLGELLGDALIETHIRPGDDLWVRIDRDAWAETGRIARDRLGCRYFCFLSGLDWLPSPYGRSLDAEVDKLVGNPDGPVTAAPAAGEVADEGEAADARAEAEAPADEPTSAAIVQGYAGGETRFQVFARVVNLKEHWGITIKADLPDDDLRVDTWIPNYAGANWHERECFEMYGFTFTGHPYLRNLYLPGAFEGHPLRKDFPLLARLVKPWPGIVDVEEMPPLPEEEGEAAEGDAAESAEGDGGEA
jgi:NADH-quinone oxidoreductase subunit C